MRLFSARMLPILTAFLVIAAASLSASTVSQFNLAEMSQRAQKIYVGTVRSATEGTIAVGGGQLAVVTYQISVDEDLRGETALVKGERVAEIRMLGKQKTVRIGNIRSVSPVPDMPVLTVGQTYLVFTTQPSGIGLSTTVGLGQGCFRVYGKGDSQMAVNEVNNAGLFRDMQPRGGTRRRRRITRRGTAGRGSRRPADRCGLPTFARRSSTSSDPGSRGRSCATRHPLLVFGAIALLLLTSVQVYAGGPLLLRAPGAPFLWPNGGRMIPFNPDQGGLGPLTNAQAVAQSTAAFQAWADIASATATHVNRGSLPVDVDETNFMPYLVARRTRWAERDRLRRGRRDLRPALRTRLRRTRFRGSGVGQHDDRRHLGRRVLHEWRLVARTGGVPGR